MRRFAGFVLSMVLFVPTAAMAHASVVDTNPANGAKVQKLPSEATITFDEQPSMANMVLTEPDGRLRTMQPDIEGSTVTAALPTDGPRGQYVVAYRVVSDDGHPVSGSIRFVVTTGEKPDFSPPSAAIENHSYGSGLPLIGILAGVGAAIIVAGALLTLRKRR